jgi:hypothetical protein
MTTETTVAPEEITATYLAVRYSTSRGRDTFGYNVVTVTDQETRKRFSCNGGGYDMLGTSLAEWMVATYQGRLRTISDRAHMTYDTEHNNTCNAEGLYGMYAYADGRVRVDGACGESSVQRIAKAIGLHLVRTWDLKGHTTGYVVSSL